MTSPNDFFCLTQQLVEISRISGNGWNDFGSPKFRVVPFSHFSPLPFLVKSGDERNFSRIETSKMWAEIVKISRSKSPRRKTRDIMHLKKPLIAFTVGQFFLLSPKKESSEPIAFGSANFHAKWPKNGAILTGFTLSA